MKRMIALVCALAVATLAFADYKNGVYAAKEAKADERGYTAEIKITVKDGKIAKIEYNESKGGKSSKWADDKYNASMKKIAGISWSEAVTAIEAKLASAQAVDKVDVVSGATELSHRFKTLAKTALEKSK